MSARSHDRVGLATIVLAAVGGFLLAAATLFGSLLLAVGVSDQGGGARSWASAAASIVLPWATWLLCVAGSRRAWRRGADTQAVALALLPLLLIAGAWLAFR